MAKDTDREEQTAKKRGSGPGFILGVLLGTLAGAAAATLFAPATGEELEQELAGQPLASERPPADLGVETERPAFMPLEAHTPVDRVRAVLTRVRSRVHQAAEEGRQASQEAEEASRARYAELTQREGPFG